MKKIHFKTFFEKVKFKYKVSILNENTLEETFHIRLSRLNVFLVICSFFFIVFLLNSVLIITTPLKYFLPGYASSDERTEIINKNISVDSISQVVARQSEYVELLQQIMSGDIQVEKVVPLDSLMLAKKEELLTKKTKAEQRFCEKFEKEEQYNLSVLTVAPKGQSEFVFFKPVKGAISQKYNPTKGLYGINISIAANQTVVSALDGTVINADFTIDDGYIITVQHPNDFISVYKNNSQLLKNTGAQVKAGEGIAISGIVTEKNTSPYLHFELWQKGKPVNPEEYIIF